MTVIGLALVDVLVLSTGLLLYTPQSECSCSLTKVIYRQTGEDSGGSYMSKKSQGARASGPQGKCQGLKILIVQVSREDIQGQRVPRTSSKN